MRVVKPVFTKYIKEGYNFRELSHEAQVAMLSLEMEYALDVLYRKTKEKARNVTHNKEKGSERGEGAS